MRVSPRTHRRLAVLAAGLTGALALGFTPVLDQLPTGPALPELPDLSLPGLFAPQLVTVDTPTRADKDLLTSLGLDLTEHAGHDYVEAVLHSVADVDALRDAGLTWDVRIPDLQARGAEIQRENEAYAASVTTSALPSGRTTYRRLEDYDAELAQLAADHPDLVRGFELEQRSLEGRPINAIEIGRDVHAPEDGRPVFAMFGLHHAREWPSGEHTIEFAYDLVKGYGQDRRITRLLNRSRVLIVPVVNPDGFKRSVDDGMIVDLRELDRGGTVSILATPSNAYKRKNCRILDGFAPLANECELLKSPGGFGVGIDLNRNYGTFWGGPGASDLIIDPTYHGPAPFSEPETQAVRELVSSRQVTTLITNHTFSNLILRPNGVAPDTIGPDGHPVGYAPDEDAMRELGAEMASHNGYVNQHGWELYDTTGTTEDWSYNATGGYGYTFEIGEHEFHPPFPEVVDEYVGAGEFAGRGNREAYLVALANAVDPEHHAIIRGVAPPGATLRLTRTSDTPTWNGSFEDTIETEMVVPSNGRYTWHVNPSTRPLVQARQIRVLAEEPIRRQTDTGTTLPLQSSDVVFELPEADVDVMEVGLDWATPDDLDLHVYRREADGSLREVGSSASFIPDKERVLLDDPQPGTYVLRVVNYASVAPTWTLTTSLYEAETETIGGVVESWTLTCEVDGEVRRTREIVVDRGDRVKSGLRNCDRPQRG